MAKKILSIIFVCIFCMTVVLTGCTDVTGDNNPASGEDDKQVSTVLAGEKGDVATAPNDAEKKAKTLLEKASLAEKGELQDTSVTNYEEFKLYINQNNETVKQLRSTATTVFPLQTLCDVTDVRYYSVWYFFSGGGRDIDKLYGDVAYFMDYFSNGYGNLNFNVFYLKPNVASNAKAGFMATVLQELKRDDWISSYEGAYDAVLYSDFNDSLIDNGNIYRLNKQYVGKPAVLSVGNNFVLHYNVSGELLDLGIYYDDVYIRVSAFSSESDIAVMSDAVNSIDGVIDSLLDTRTMSLAAEALRTAVTEANQVVK